MGRGVLEPIAIATPTAGVFMKLAIEPMPAVSNRKMPDFVRSYPIRPLVSIQYSRAETVRIDSVVVARMLAEA